MNTILIVEDETMVRQGLKAMILKSGVPVEEIMECSNGEAALEVVKKHKIDVMFTDIRMPKMNGIELVKQIKECEHVPLVVVISGYDNFSYATEMLRNGVREYLLKPIERDKIAAILQQLEEEISVQKEKREVVQRVGFQQVKYLMLNEQIMPEEIETLREQYEKYFYQGNYVVCICESREREVEKDLCIYYKQVKGQDIFVVEEEHIAEVKQRYFADSCTGISSVHRGIAELQSAYREAQAARKYAFCRCKSEISDEWEEESIPAKLREEAEKFLDMPAKIQRVQLIGTEKTEELLRVWNCFFKVVKQGRILPQEFEEMMRFFFSEAERTYRKVIGELSGDMESIGTIWEYRTIEEYEKECMDWILELHTYIQNQFNMNQKKQKMKEAVVYIKEHYNEDINMAVVSNHLSMNYSLFSYSFKQYTGCNFVNYIKNIRMQDAKKLLTETDKKVIEISKEVGYDNEKHFMKLFKATFGVSPSEYRKNMRS